MSYGATGLASPRSNISGYKMTQTPNFSPEQMQLFQSLIGKIGGGAGNGVDYLSKLASGDEGLFSQMEAPAYRSLERSQSSLANKYAGVGALGSSGFQQQASGQAGELAQNLASRRGDLQRMAIERLLGLSGELLGQKPYNYGMQEEDQGFDWGSLLGGLGGMAGSAFLGPAAGAFGKGAGDWISKLFR